MALVLVAMEYSESEMDDPPLRMAPSPSEELAYDDADDVRTLLLIMETLLPDRERVIFRSGSNGQCSMFKESVVASFATEDGND